MTTKLIRRHGKFVIDESTPEFNEAGYDEPMRHMDEDLDVLVRREIEETRSVA